MGRIAGLIFAYKKAFDRQTKPSPAAFPSVRVITVDAVIKIGNQVHTYDQVQSFIDSHDPIAVSTCYCRHAAVLRGEDTHGLPNDVCMQFGLWAQFAVERLGARLVTTEEALESLREAVALILADRRADGLRGVPDSAQRQVVVVE